MLLPRRILAADGHLSGVHAAQPHVGRRARRLEGLVSAAAIPGFSGRRVLVTGHTGFKGAWLSEWLTQTGARVSGIALPPDYPDNLFDVLRLAERMDHAICDLRDPSAIAEAVRR